MVFLWAVKESLGTTSKCFSRKPSDLFKNSKPSHRTSLIIATQFSKSTCKIIISHTPQPETCITTQRTLAFFFFLHVRHRCPILHSHCPCPSQYIHPSPSLTRSSRNHFLCSFHPFLGLSVLISLSLLCYLSCVYHLLSINTKNTLPSSCCQLLNDFGQDVV